MASKKQKDKNQKFTWLRGLYFGAIFLYLYLPMVVMVVGSFNANRYGFRWDGFSLKWFVAMANNAALMEALWHSLLVATAAACASAVLGSFAAIALTLYRFRGGRVMVGSIGALMMVPDITLAIALLVLFVVLGIPLGFWSLFLAHVTFCMPFAVITIAARLQGFDPALLDAARDLGASESASLRRVVFPLMKPAIIAAWLLSFTLSLDDVIISSFLTGPSFDVLPLKIFSMVKVGVKPEVNALATLLTAFSLIMVLISSLLLKEKKEK